MDFEQQRQAFLGALFGTGNAKRRTLWAEFGYPNKLDFRNFYRAYKRNAVAFAAVTRLLDGSWADLPIIVEGGTENESKETSKWETLIESLMKKHWRSVKEADLRNLVGRYSGLLLQVKDGKDWKEEIEPQSLSSLGVLGLVKLIPVWEEQLKVASTQDNPLAEDYGEPLTYQFNESSFTKGKKGRSLIIHRSRVILFNEGGETNNPESGVSLLEPGYNKLLDLEKTSGGSAEGFLKNASRQLGIKVSKEVNLTELENASRRLGFNNFNEALNSQIQKLNSGTDSALVTQEGDAQVLSVSPADPKPTWEVSANEFAASVQIPFTILFGQQTGRLASDEDKTDWAKRCNARRNGFLSDVITQLITRFWQIGIIPPPATDEITVSWSDLLAPGEKEKIANAQALANVATTTQSAFGSPAISANEVRESLGFEPLPENTLPPELDNEDTED